MGKFSIIFGSLIIHTYFWKVQLQCLFLMIWSLIYVNIYRYVLYFGVIGCFEFYFEFLLHISKFYNSNSDFISIDDQIAFLKSCNLLWLPDSRVLHPTWDSRAECCSLKPNRIKMPSLFLFQLESPTINSICRNPIRERHFRINPTNRQKRIFISSR